MPGPFQREALESTSADEILLASTEKKQRTEVKLSMLSPEENKLSKRPKGQKSKIGWPQGQCHEYSNPNLHPNRFSDAVGYWYGKTKKKQPKQKPRKKLC